jgi:hypothetical protein
MEPQHYTDTPVFGDYYETLSEVIAWLRDPPPANPWKPSVNRLELEYSDFDIPQAVGEFASSHYKDYAWALSEVKGAYECELCKHDANTACVEYADDEWQVEYSIDAGLFWFAVAKNADAALVDDGTLKIVVPAEWTDENTDHEYEAEYYCHPTEDKALAPATEVLYSDMRQASETTLRVVALCLLLRPDLVAVKRTPQRPEPAQD